MWLLLAVEVISRKSTVYAVFIYISLHTQMNIFCASRSRAFMNVFVQVHGLATSNAALSLHTAENVSTEDDDDLCLTILHHL